MPKAGSTLIFEKEWTQEQKQDAGTVTQPEPRDIRAENKQLIDDVNKNWFRLSLNLAETYDKELWKYWVGAGFDNFKAYCEQELHLEYRIAMWRVQMGRAISKFGITEEMVANLGGWTKFKEWTRLLTVDGVQREELLGVLQAIKEMTFEQTKEYVESIITEHKGGEEVQKVTLTFNMVGEAANVVKAALKEVMSLIDGDSESQALEYMCLDYGANSNQKLNEKFQDLVKKHREMGLKKAPKEHRKEHANKGKAHAAKASKKKASKKASKKSAKKGGK
jgi:hypothetical protein